MIFIKRSELVLDCFTSNPSSFEFSRPDYAVKFIPDWWKKLPKVNECQFGAQPNMKHCAGFVDYFRSGIALPMWSDLDVKVGPVGSEHYIWQYSDGESHATSHNPWESGSFIDPKETVHLKLIYPWRFKCKDDVRWLWTHFGWQQPIDTSYKVLPGALSFNYQTGANINILFMRRQTETLTQLKFRTPLVHVAPISDKKLTLKHHLISSEQFQQMQRTVTRSSFVGSYKKIKKYLMENSECNQK